jgi:hypothetical protein
MHSIASPSIAPQTDSTPVRISRDARAFPLGDDLLLFSKRSGSLLRANPMAALIWSGFSDGLEWETMVALLSDTFGQPRQQIVSDIKKLTIQWQRCGLIHSNQRTIGDRAKQREDSEPLIACPFPIPENRPGGVQSCYRLLDLNIHLRLPGLEASSIIHPILDHLSVPGMSDCNVHLEVRRGADHYVLLSDGELVDWCSDERGLAPMIHANLHLLAYQRGHHLVGIHAAAVVYGNHVILMPANCGSGKSTLTAGLVSSGFTYCSDDMVFLTSRPVCLRSAPMSMGIKSGSWNVLKTHFPQLSSLASHERADGKRVRYLPPPMNAFIKEPNRPMAVTHLLFPRFRSQGKVKLNPISPADGLCRIAQAGYDVKGSLTEACLEQLVKWISDIPCYEFHYRNLDEAVSILKEFLK